MTNKIKNEVINILQKQLQIEKNKKYSNFLTFLIDNFDNCENNNLQNKRKKKQRISSTNMFDILNEESSFI